ncbi:hypothetical protein HJG60_008042 [Phyllostomus discolor]|uniref:Uncharacterized protein n=1 Tax=Phyllostomus discolor TaxID=89673 RepID=A0A834BDM7_9CHIR|nr:hypothetical protein HJG60_008042 [Phyllostomus discolor]
MNWCCKNHTLMRSHPLWPSLPLGFSLTASQVVLERDFRHRLVFDSGGELLASVATAVSAMHRMIGKRCGKAWKMVVLVEEGKPPVCLPLCPSPWGGKAHRGLKGNGVPGPRRSSGSLFLTKQAEKKQQPLLGSPRRSEGFPLLSYNQDWQLKTRNSAQPTLKSQNSS